MTPEHRAALVAELKRSPYAGKSADDAFALLFHGVTVTSSQTVGAAFSFASLLGILSQSSLVGVMSSPSFPDVRQCVLSQDRQGLGIFAAGFAQAAIIAPEEYAAIVALVSATEQQGVSTFVDPLFSSADCLLHGVEGIPNVFERVDFDAAFVEANS